MVKVTLERVFFSYGAEEVLKNISFEASPGEITAIIGPNGAGKTTLLRIIAGLLKPKAGRVLLNDLDVSRMGRDEIVKMLSYLPQESTIPGILTVYETVLLGRMPYLTWRINSKDLELTEKILEDLGLKKYALRYATQLSGGERQLVFIAQALVREPGVLLLDEPVSNLDIRHQLEMLDLIRSLTIERGITTIMVLHDLNLATRYANKMIVLSEGELVAMGAPMAILRPEIFRRVYRIDVKINENDSLVHIIPLRPLKN